MFNFEVGQSISILFSFSVIGYMSLLKLGRPTWGPGKNLGRGWHDPPLSPPENRHWVLERSPQPPSNFYAFLIKKNTHFSIFFIEKGHALSAITMDNARIYSQLKSKSIEAWLKLVKGGAATIISLRNID